MRPCGGAKGLEDFGGFPDAPPVVLLVQACRVSPCSEIAANDFLDEFRLAIRGPCSRWTMGAITLLSKPGDCLNLPERLRTTPGEGRCRRSEVDAYTVKRARAPPRPVGPKGVSRKASPQTLPWRGKRKSGCCRVSSSFPGRALTVLLAPSASGGRPRGSGLRWHFRRAGLLTMVLFRFRQVRDREKPASGEFYGQNLASLRRPSRTPPSIFCPWGPPLGDAPAPTRCR